MNRAIRLACRHVAKKLSKYIQSPYKVNDQQWGDSSGIYYGHAIIIYGPTFTIDKEGYDKYVRKATIAIGAASGEIEICDGLKQLWVVELAAPNCFRLLFAELQRRGYISSEAQYNDNMFNVDLRHRASAAQQ